MMTTLLIAIACIGAALIGGVFFAFSSFVMAALGRLPSAQGMLAMQEINRTVLNPGFLGTFIGTAVVGFAASVSAFLAGLPLGWVLAGASIYALGSIVVTGTANVPRNERLARMDAASPQGEAEWRRYLQEWTRWNHVRTAASLIAAACFALALRG